MDWVTIITTVGFPIVAAGACAWFIKYITDAHREELQRMTENHKTEIDTLTNQHRNESQAWTDALNNNTLVIQKLCDKLDSLAERSTENGKD